MPNPNGQQRHPIAAERSDHPSELRPLLGVNEVSNNSRRSAGHVVSLALNDIPGQPDWSSRLSRRASPPILIGGPGDLHRRSAKRHTVTGMVHRRLLSAGAPQF
jgi:hypothetical protein